MTQSNSAKTLVAAIAVALAVSFGSDRSDAAPPSVVRADIDYDASGFVAPAGMVPPSQYSGGVMPIGYYDSVYPPAGCDSPGGCGGMCGGVCSGGGGCDSPCGTGCGGRRCGFLGCGGVLGKLSGQDTACGGCRQDGCPSCGGLSCFRHLCMFCRGQGCSACQGFNAGAFVGCLSALLPYSEQGLCAQRWYDLSIEGMVLSHSNGGLNAPITTFGQAPGDPGDPVPADQIVLRLGDADSGGDGEAGIRLSGALIWGPGGNIEATYIGGQEWGSTASVQDENPVFFSFISDFGREPIGGYDDTDRSLFQSISNRSEFHSVELNYRRRTVWPYCRFQGSWLVGLRYVRFEDTIQYTTLGELDNTVNMNLPRFFSAADGIDNHLFGPQAGFDFWWNIIPGVHLGLGFKGAWVQNDVDRRTQLTANSLPIVEVATLFDGERRGTTMGEFEAKFVYRLSHSWAFRTSYWALAVDDAAFGFTDFGTINDFVNANPLTPGPVRYHSLTVQGVSFGTEFTW